MFLASKSFTVNEHIRLLSDNATAIFYINKMEKENGDLSFDGLSLSNNNNMGVGILNECPSNCSIYFRQMKYCYRKSIKNMPYKWLMDASLQKFASGFGIT